MTEHPVPVDLLPPCNLTCPAGDYHAAWSALVQHNPLPAVMGRICYHPCESNCNRAHFDESVNIHAVERFLGDEAIRQGWQFDPAPPSTGKHVLVVGSGPAGLAAAYHLRRLGHEVTIREAASLAGGMMRYGIPRYRLPRNILDAEIARIEAMGVAVELDSKVEDVQCALKDFDGVFLAVGAHIAKRTVIPAHDAARILDAVTLLRGMESGVTPALGRRVLVYGGGNTALDAARTAKRLGASETLIIYRRTREKMPAHEFEVQEALDEGVSFQWLSTVKAAGQDDFTIEKMRLDETGFPQPTGEFETLEGSTLILALGQESDLSFLNGVPGISLTDGVVEVNQHMMTGCPGLFAGGDMIPAERTVTVGISHGKKAARNIDAWLKGHVYKRLPRHEIATFERLNPRHWEHAARTIQPALDLDTRLSTFAEVFGGLQEPDAACEAHRCLSCGNCRECDNCYEICPGDAVLKHSPGKRIAFDYENCDGCGLCAEECPCGAIEMQVGTVR